MPKKVNPQNFEQLINGKKPVLIDFFATWCGPCSIMSPVIKEIADEAKGVEVTKLDIDEFPEIAARYNVMSVPTFIIFKNGKEIERMIGAMPKELILEKIHKAIK